MTFKHLLFGLAGMAALAACTTSAPSTGMDGNFETVLAEALGTANPYEADAAMTALLARTDLSDDQRARALYRRGSLRRMEGNDRPGAVEDFEAMLEIAPSHALAGNARTELSFARTDLQNLQANELRLLTHAEWFDTVWALGKRQEAADRYRNARLSPTVEQVKSLEQAGFICSSDGEGPLVYQLGDMRDDLKGKTWCDA